MTTEARPDPVPSRPNSPMEPLRKSIPLSELLIGVADLLREIDAAEKDYADKCKARTRAEQEAGLAWRHLCALQERLQKEHGLRRVSKENPS